MIAAKVKTSSTETFQAVKFQCCIAKILTNANFAQTIPTCCTRKTQYESVTNFSSGTFTAFKRSKYGAKLNTTTKSAMAAIKPRQSVLIRPGISTNEMNVKVINEISATRNFRNFSKFSTRKKPRQNLKAMEAAYNVYNDDYTNGLSDNNTKHDIFS